MNWFSSPPPEPPKNDNGAFILIILFLLLVLANKNKNSKWLPRFSKKSNSLDKIIGLESVKDEIKYYMDFIKNSKKYKDWDVKLPKGILLAGPPGTGKTLLVKTLSQKLDIPLKDFYLTKNEIQKMNDLGMIIGSHTVNHPVLSTLSYDEQKYEILGIPRKFI